MLPWLRDCPAAASHDSPFGSVGLRPCGSHRRDPRDSHRRGSDGNDDPALSGELAKYDHYRHFDPIVDSQFGDHAEPPRRDDQHHDTRRAALAVGILVDDATVTIENIERFIEEGQRLREAILDGAAQIAVPALVSTLCICIVFLPMFFLGGVARYLFVPLAEAVVFAMLASYIFSRTLVPTLAMYLLKAKDHGASSGKFFTRFQRGLSVDLTACADGYQLLLTRLVYCVGVGFVPVFLLLCLSAFLLVPWLGQDFFPSTDGGNFILHVRGKTGLRIEETARLCDLVEQSIRQKFLPTNSTTSLTISACLIAA